MRVVGLILNEKELKAVAKQKKAEEKAKAEAEVVEPTKDEVKAETVEV